MTGPGLRIAVLVAAIGQHPVECMLHYGELICGPTYEAGDCLNARYEPVPCPTPQPAEALAVGTRVSFRCVGLAPYAEEVRTDCPDNAVCYATYTTCEVIETPK